MNSTGQLASVGVGSAPEGLLGTSALEFIQGEWLGVKSGDLGGKAAISCTEESRNLWKRESTVCKKLEPYQVHAYVWALSVQMVMRCKTKSLWQKTIESKSLKIQFEGKEAESAH